jgi:hypothetical protein
VARERPERLLALRERLGVDHRHHAPVARLLQPERDRPDRHGRPAFLLERRPTVDDDVRTKARHRERRISGPLAELRE